MVSVGTISAVAAVEDLVALLVVRLDGAGGVCNTVTLVDMVGTCRVNFPGSVGRRKGSDVGIALYASSGITNAK